MSKNPPWREDEFLHRHTACETAPPLRVVAGARGRRNTPPLRAGFAARTGRLRARFRPDFPGSDEARRRGGRFRQKRGGRLFGAIPSLMRRFAGKRLNAFIFSCLASKNLSLFIQFYPNLSYFTGIRPFFGNGRPTVSEGDPATRRRRAHDAKCGEMRAAASP